MIIIKNTQRTYPINKKELEQVIAQVLTTVGYPEYDLTIWFTTNTTIRKYNKQFRRKDVATDVISFPYYETKKPGILPTQSDQEPILGDIILSPEYINKHLSDWDNTLEERIIILIVHSVCHLLGYDHETDHDYTIMAQEEKRLMTLLHKL